MDQYVNSLLQRQRGSNQVANAFGPGSPPISSYNLSTTSAPVATQKPGGFYDANGNPLVKFGVSPDKMAVQNYTSTDPKTEAQTNYAIYNQAPRFSGASVVNPKSASIFQPWGASDFTSENQMGNVPSGTPYTDPRFLGTPDYNLLDYLREVEPSAESARSQDIEQSLRGKARYPGSTGDVPGRYVFQVQPTSSSTPTTNVISPGINSSDISIPPPSSTVDQSFTNMNNAFQQPYDGGNILGNPPPGGNLAKRQGIARKMSVA